MAMTHDPTSMKAIVCKRFGDVNVLEECQVSKPTISSPHDLLVRVHSVGSNPVDFKVRNGAFGSMLKADKDHPLILGWDCCGIVEKCGDQCRLFKNGDRVFFAGAVQRQGCFAQYCVVDERICGRAPHTLSDADCAALPLVSLTAWEAFEEQMNIPLDKKMNSHRTMLICPGASGVGSLAIQLAKRVFGIGTVIGTASRPESRDYCMSMGADLVIDARKGIRDELKHHNIDSVDYTFNMISDNDYMRQYSKIGAPLGKVCTIVGLEGLDMGTVPEMYLKRMTLAFEMMFARPLYNVDMERQHHILNNISSLMDDGTLKSIKTKEMTFSLDHLKEIQRIQESGKAIGKMVMTCDKY